MGLMMAIVVFMGLSAFLVIYIDRLYGQKTEDDSKASDKTADTDTPS